VSKNRCDAVPEGTLGAVRKITPGPLPPPYLALPGTTSRHNWGLVLNPTVLWDSPCSAAPQSSALQREDRRGWANHRLKVAAPILAHGSLMTSVTPNTCAASLALLSEAKYHAVRGTGLRWSSHPDSFLFPPLARAPASFLRWRALSLPSVAHKPAANLWTRRKEGQPSLSHQRGRSLPHPLDQPPVAAPLVPAQDLSRHGSS